LNNPLKYIDPTGHDSHEGGYYDQGDWYYESLCEAKGVDPANGYIFWLGGDEITYMTVDDHNSLCDSTRRRMPDILYNIVGIRHKGYIVIETVDGRKTTGNIFIINENGLFERYFDGIPVVGDAIGISLCPVGIFIREDYENNSILILHESYHYGEQFLEGSVEWYGEYIVDWAVNIVLYLDLNTAHDFIDAEQRAMIYSGEQKGFVTPPLPWWK
jgi:hypothetical protein